MPSYDNHVIRGDIGFIRGALERGDDFVSGLRMKITNVNAGQFLAAGMSSYITSGLYNPLDCLRVRWQMVPSSHYMSSEGIISFASHIIRNEGLIQGLWRPGILASATGMGLTSSLRFGCYERVRDTIVGFNGSNNKTGVHMMLAGMICGGGAYFVTTPFHLLKTKLQVESSSSGPRSMTQMGLSRIRKHGILSLWKGSIPISIRGSCFTAGQMYGYDGFKTMCKSSYQMEDTPKLHIISSMAAALGATILSSPADFVSSRYMSSASDIKLTHCVEHIYVEHGRGVRGILGFWKGSGLTFIRLTPGLLTFNTIYEQCRFNLGLGYLS